MTPRYIRVSDGLISYQDHRPGPGWAAIPSCGLEGELRQDRGYHRDQDPGMRSFYYTSGGRYIRIICREDLPTATVQEATEATVVPEGELVVHSSARGRVQWVSQPREKGSAPTDSRTPKERLKEVLELAAADEARLEAEHNEETSGSSSSTPGAMERMQEIRRLAAEDDARLAEERKHELAEQKTIDPRALYAEHERKAMAAEREAEKVPPDPPEAA